MQVKSNKHLFFDQIDLTFVSTAATQEADRRFKARLEPSYVEFACKSSLRVLQLLCLLPCYSWDRLQPPSLTL